MREYVLQLFFTKGRELQRIKEMMYKSITGKRVSQSIYSAVTHRGPAVIMATVWRHKTRVEQR